MVESNHSIGERKVHLIVINLIRFLLVFAFFGAVYNHRLLVMFISGLAFFVTFFPWILNKLWKIKIPSELEIMVILFIYGSLFFGEVRGFYAQYWWWDVLLNLVSSIALGLVGLTILYSLYRDETITASPWIIAVFAFSFTVAISSIWEIFEFGLDSLFGFNLQKSGLVDTMGDLIVNVIGASIISITGYFYIRDGKISFISSLISRFIELNPRIFGVSKKPSTEEEIFNLVKKGESEDLEFKSTMRFNLHTSQIDSKVEHAVLKTVAAYLNSDGGTLLVGVSDSGEIIGLEKDNFENKDKIGLHFTNLIKHHLGGEVLPFIKFKVISVKDKIVLKVDCRQGRKEVFLKFGGEEEFYVRNGPSSMKLSGSSLVDYIHHKFK